ncbi:MAG TPA: isoleucine--tRNA ligase [Firmicutes bacterium]|nr:isoleucine--tRNA ligase [Bacillota bacterium]
MDYRSTLQLLTTDFPMRANLPVREVEIQKRWAKARLYEKLQEKGQREGRPKFILHDGPPYANGHIHIGTALNKVLKDIVVRSKSLDGYLAPFVPGWDTHGLPVEHAVVKSQKQPETDPIKLRQACKEYALKFLDIQREEFKRLGGWGDWDNPYVTLDPKYEAEQIRVFGDMYAKGNIYKGLKPVYWCMSCQTALAEAEIEYHDAHSHSIYVKFTVTDGKGVLPEDAAVVIWTTTPWTLPANMAVCLHPAYTYVLVETNQGKLLVAKDLAEQFAGELELSTMSVVGEYRGEELEGILCRHPLEERTVPLILGMHVTLEQGTGCVHTAPGHGVEDYEVGLSYDLPVYAPVDAQGNFTQEAGKYAGMNVAKVNPVIVEDLQEAGLLLKSGKITHQYPHCWRCKEPVIFRATEQWFASIDGFREDALKAIDEVQWIPEWGSDRIGNMVRERHDWCISRQRKWGVPIPIFYCQDCGNTILDENTIESISAVFAVEGSDAWFRRSPEELLPEGYVCGKCGGSRFTKETDIMDVWFDSGSSHRCVLAQRPELGVPADLYLEGSDQHRGWFQSSLLTAVATSGKPPYKAVLTHGFIVDAEGNKMSKSLGNVMAPDEVIKKYGADVFRLWVASSDYRHDIRISDTILGQMAEAYRRIRNTARFLLGNLHDFSPAKDGVPMEELSPLDKWALMRVNEVAARVIEAYREYDFHIVYRTLYNFCVVDMGGFYLDVLKDTLYCDAADSFARRSAQTAMYQILLKLTQLAAPLIPHTADEIWQHARQLDPSLEESVHLTTWSVSDVDEEELTKWERFLRVRRVAMKALEEKRAFKEIGSSNEAVVSMYVDEEAYGALLPFLNDLERLLMVSKVTVHRTDTLPETGVSLEECPGVKAKVEVTDAEKCERCWRYLSSVGEDEEFKDLCARCVAVIKS